MSTPDEIEPKCLQPVADTELDEHMARFQGAMERANCAALDETGGCC